MVWWVLVAAVGALNVTTECQVACGGVSPHPGQGKVQSSSSFRAHCETCSWTCATCLHGQPCAPDCTAACRKTPCSGQTAPLQRPAAQLKPAARQALAGVASHAGARARSSRLGADPEDPPPDADPSAGEDSTVDPSDPKSIDKAQKDAEKEVVDLPDRMDNVADDGRRDALKYKDVWFPGWEPEPYLVISSSIGVLATMIWLVLFYRCFYFSDRPESLDWWHKKAKELGVDDAAESPDLVLVFRNPGVESADAGEEIPQDQLKKLLVNDVQTDEFTRMRQLTQAKTAEKGDLRTALLQDVRELLPKLGFNVRTFCTVDNAEVLVAVTLDSEDVVDYYFMRDHRYCQLQQALTGKLGVVQDPTQNASAAGWLRYNHGVIEQLKPHVAGVNEVADVFRVYRGSRKEGSVSRGVDRTRIVFAELATHFDLETATDTGLVSNFYAVHNRRCLSQLRGVWAATSAIWDFSFRQPVHLLQAYYGSKVAFFFAWAGFYCKALLALLVPATICIALMVASQYFEYRRGFLIEVLQLGFGVVVIVWAAGTRNLFLQDAQYFVEYWHLWAPKRLPRPQYEGSLQRSRIDGSQMERRANNVVLSLTRYFSTLVTIVFCLLVMVAIYGWMTVFHGQMNIVASIVLALQIKVFEIIYRPIAMWLTRLENHKYQVDFINALIWKTFAFQFINYYYAFFYLMIAQKFTEAGCPMVRGIGHDCIWALRRQVIATVGFLAVCRLIEVFANWGWVKLQIFLQNRSLARSAGGAEAPVRSYMEEQAYLADFEEAEQMEAKLQLVLSLGFVLLFACIAPVVVVVVFVVFVVQLRASAWYLTNVARRSFPREAGPNGIGAWNDVIAILMGVGVISSALVLVIHGEAFRGQHILTRISFVIVFAFVSFVMWEVLRRSQPEEDSETALLKSRRQHVQAKLSLVGQALPKATHVASSREEEEQARYVSSGQWRRLRPMNRTHEDWGKVDTPDNAAQLELEEPARVNDPSDMIP
mmetsp:Transcript_86526/g.231963  ORF Transcript_86526/g.231963 Transcript_86526/m.231963 type:complete len:990 (+) Transcript_86526:129-3098(+)